MQQMLEPTGEKTASSYPIELASFPASERRRQALTKAYLQPMMEFNARKEGNV
jgi:hypothetical protein